MEVSETEPPKSAARRTNVSSLVIRTDHEIVASTFYRAENSTGQWLSFCFIDWHPATHGALRRLLMQWSLGCDAFMNICCPRCGGLAEPAGHEDARAFFQCPTCSRVWATHISASASHDLPASMAPRVLIADDSREMLGLLTAWLEDEGCVVIAASSGREAIDAADAYKPDVAFIDIVLPPPDGFHVSEVLTRKMGIAVVLVTGMSSPDAAAGRGSGSAAAAEKAVRARSAGRCADAGAGAAPAERSVRRDRVGDAVASPGLLARPFPQRPADLGNHRIRRAQPVVQNHHRDVGRGRPSQRLGVGHVSDDQVRPQRVHDAGRLREGMGRGDREPQLGEDGLTPRAAVGVFVDEQHQRRESRPDRRADARRATGAGGPRPDACPARPSSEES